MNTTLKFFEDLGPGDFDWFFDNGTERRFDRDEILFEEGSVPPGIYFILEGLVEVRSRLLGGEILARLGNGEIIGEMSFLEKQAATASVVASEETLVLGVLRQVLEDRLDTDTDFAARFYRAIARGLVHRLRESVARVASSEASVEAIGPWAELSRCLEVFKKLLLKLDRGGEEVPRDDPRWAQVGTALTELAAELKSVIGDNDQAIGKELGARVRREILPWLMLSEIGKRLYEKPRGYVGDYLTIAKIYESSDRRSGSTGNVVNAAVREQPAIKAINSRRALVAREIVATVEGRHFKPARVTSLACGPASEIFDAFSELDSPKHLKATLIDVDQKAIEVLEEHRQGCGLGDQIDLVGANLVYLALGRQELELPEQHLIYSTALIDTLSDRYVMVVLNFIYDHLAQGGRVLLGSLHPSNPSRALMEHVLGWDARHRYESDIHRLFETSKFASKCSRILWEGERVNFFAECIKR